MTGGTGLTMFSPDLAHKFPRCTLGAGRHGSGRMLSHGTLGAGTEASLRGIHPCRAFDARRLFHLGDV
jgi:hypothetical protein